MQSTVPLGVDLMQNNNPNNISNLFTGGTIETNNTFQSTSTFFVKDQAPSFMNFRRIANETPNNFSLNLPITAINTPTPSHKRKSSTPSTQSTDTTSDTVRSQPTRKRKSKLLAGDTPITIPITIPNHNNNNNNNNTSNTTFNGTPIAISVSPLSSTTTSTTTTTTSPTQNQGGINSSQELLAEKEEGANASGNANGTGMVTIGGKLYHESQLDSIDDSTLTADERKQLKKQRRLVKNREAAQLFRQRQKEYIVNLEKRAAELTQANHEASARVELLSSENKLMKEQLVYLRNFMKQAVSFSFPFDPKVMGFTPFQAQQQQPPSLATLPTTPNNNNNNNNNNTTVSTPPISINSPPISSSSPTTLDTPPITIINNNYSPMPIMSVSGSITPPTGTEPSSPPSTSTSTSTTSNNNQQLQATADITKDLQNPLYPD